MERALRQWIKSEYLMVRLFPMPIDQHQEGVTVLSIYNYIPAVPFKYQRAHYTTNRIIAYIFRLEPFT